MLAAAAAAVLFVGGAFLGQSFNNSQFESQQASGLAQINSADDSQRAATTTADGQEATLVWSNKLGISAVLVDNLPVLSGDQDYQLWYITGEGAVSAGIFDSSGDGTAWRVGLTSPRATRSLPSKASPLAARAVVGAADQSGS
jgi:hypothetical protein